jgi:hypothetical protein
MPNAYTYSVCMHAGYAATSALPQYRQEGPDIIGCGVCGREAECAGDHTAKEALPRGHSQNPRLGIDRRLYLHRQLRPATIDDSLLRRVHIHSAPTGTHVKYFGKRTAKYLK